MLNNIIIKGKIENNKGSKALITNVNTGETYNLTFKNDSLKLKTL